MKYYKTHQNISLGSSGVDRVSSLRKVPTRLRGTNFCTSSVCFAPSFVRQPNGPECTQIVRNAPKCQFTVQWGGSDELLRKILTRLRGTNFCSNCTNSAHFAQSFMQQWNDPKCTQTLWNGSKHGFRVQWGGSGASLWKIPTRLRGTNFCLNYTSPAPFCTKFCVVMKRSQMHTNTTERTKTWV